MGIMSSKDLCELINTTLLIHSEKLSNLERDILTGILDQLNHAQVLSDKQIKLCQRLLRKTNPTCVFIYNPPPAKP